MNRNTQCRHPLYSNCPTVAPPGGLVREGKDEQTRMKHAEVVPVNRRPSNCSSAIISWFVAGAGPTPVPSGLSDGACCRHTSDSFASPPTPSPISPASSFASPGTARHLPANSTVTLIPLYRAAGTNGSSMILAHTERGRRRRRHR